MARSRLGAMVAAVAIAVTFSGCGSGDKPPTDKSTAAPVTIADLKPFPDDISRLIDDPVDLGVPEKYDLIARSLSGNLVQILKVSFVEPSTWKLASDEDAVDAVAAAFGSVGEANSASLADSLLATTRENAVDGERVATRFASTFAPDAQPPEAYIYKVAWDTSVDKKSKTVKVTAVLWAGYEVEGQVVISARQFSLSGIDQGPNVGYSMSTPISGGFYDLCSSSVDGVFAPDEDGISKKYVAALRKEFGDQQFRPLLDAIADLAAAGGDSDSAKDREQKVEACVAKG